MTTLIAPLLAFALQTGTAPSPTLSVHLVASRPSPQPVGTAIALLPRTENEGKGMLVFRYSLKVGSEPWHIVRDFSQQRDFVWGPPLFEHDARLRVTVRNNETKATADDEIGFRIVSRVTGSQPTITPTANPLIALLSALPCSASVRFRVAFQRQGSQTTSYTPLEECDGVRSRNVYVAGMRADSEYRLRPELVNGSDVKPGPWMPFHTGLLDGDFPRISIPVPRPTDSNATQPVLIHSVASVTGARRPFATDLEGNLIWYLRSSEFLTRMLPRGRLLVLADGANSVNEMRRLQIVREMDLAGNSIRETNVGRIAEQLEHWGIHSDCKKGGKECVPGIHHEAIRLPNGHTLVIAGLERLFPAGTQGSKGPVDILGDLVIDLDADFQVSSVWNAFDHLDLNRASWADSKCKIGPGSGGCPPIFLADEANGWLHSNSLNYMPATGDFLISMPEQNWVIAIDWRNGAGTGNVKWRLGDGGDFRAIAGDPDPWFSFQHDAGFDPAGSNLISILDDGHTRKKKDPAANNRGQLWKIDEAAHTATLMHNADLGVYSIAVGSAQSLENGGYTFEAGFINPPSIFSRAVETSAAGKVVYAQQVDGVVVYRSFRVADLYSVPTK